MAEYCTTTEADTYFERRLNKDAWTDASTADKETALKESTDIIDRLNYYGEKTDENQELQFPRNDDTEVPQDIKNACAEVALALLDGVDPDMEYENIRMTSQAYANVRSTYRDDAPAEYIGLGIPSVRAWRLLKPYIRDTSEIDLSRVS